MIMEEVENQLIRHMINIIVTDHALLDVSYNSIIAFFRGRVQESDLLIFRHLIPTVLYKFVLWDYLLLLFSMD
jgi:hypothetical protein